MWFYNRSFFCCCFLHVLFCLVLKIHFVLLITRENCGEKMDEFLKRCFYHSGQYDSLEHFTELDKMLKQHEVINYLVLWLLYEGHNLMRGFQVMFLIQFIIVSSILGSETSAEG